MSLSKPLESSVFKPAQLYLVIGKSRQGKTYLLTHLAQWFLANKFWEFGLCFTRSKFTGCFNWLPDYAVAPGWDEQLLEQYLTKLEAYAQAHGGKCPGNFVIIDDVISMINQQGKVWTDFIMRYRQYNITVFITTQYVNKLQPLVKEQGVYAFMFEQSTKKSKMALYDTWGSEFENLKEFDKFMKDAIHNEKYRSLVYIHDQDDHWGTYKAPADQQIVKYSFLPQEKKEAKQEKKKR